jgi:excinuclease UvrABC nuclease subunit
MINKKETVMEGDPMDLATVLKETGMKPVGQFSMAGGELDLELGEAHEKKGVYLFVVDGQVKYVGETKKGLKKRLYGYTNPGPSQLTNIRVNSELKNVLSGGKKAEIWFLEIKHWETELIERFRPEWNLALKG